MYWFYDAFSKMQKLSNESIKTIFRDLWLFLKHWIENHKLNDERLKYHDICIDDCMIMEAIYWENIRDWILKKGN